MAFVAIGKVTVTSAGTAVQITSTPTNASTVYIQANPANSGTNIYVGDSKNTVGSTRAHVGIICPKTALTPVILRDTKAAGFDLSAIWIDADTTNDSAIVGYSE